VLGQKYLHVPQHQQFFSGLVPTLCRNLPKVPQANHDTLAQLAPTAAISRLALVQVCIPGAFLHQLCTDGHIWFPSVCSRVSTVEVLVIDVAVWVEAAMG
jgi:hypothetical protein